MAKKKSNYPRHDSDHYPTPVPAALAALERLATRIDEPKSIVDPGCGKGNWAIAARTIWPKAYIVGLDTTEYPQARDIYDEYIVNNFLAWEAPHPFDLAMGNTPYKDNACVHFLNQTRTMMKPTGAICFLFRLAFYSSADRIGPKGVLTLYGPHHQEVYSPRISFIESGEKAGNTDFDEHAQYTWLPREEGALVFPQTQPLHWTPEDKKSLDRVNEMPEVRRRRQTTIFDFLDEGQPVAASDSPRISEDNNGDPFYDDATSATQFQEQFAEYLRTM